MGVIIWYKVAFQAHGPAGALSPLTISNDVYNGTYIVDADITLKMSLDASIDTFEIKCNNFPEEVATLLKGSVKATPDAPLQAEIHLGYFDDFARFRRVSPVMIGAIKSVQSGAVDNGKGLQETTVKGQELAGYRLNTSEHSYSNAGPMDANLLIQQIAARAGVPVAPGSILTGALDNFTMKDVNGIAALSQVAEKAQALLVVGDGQISLGAPLIGGEKPPVRFDSYLNIVEMTEEVTAGKAEAALSVDLTVLGDPTLRVGQKAVLVQEGKTLPALYLISALQHKFSREKGYTCAVTLTPMEDVKKLAHVGSKPEVKKPEGADGLIQSLLETVEKSHKPAFDIGEIAAYEELKHRSTLKYGQRPSSTTEAPSVMAKVENDTTLFSKPIVSPFAWHRCGLVVPVYPGMRALLGHNLDLVNDAVVTGFLWSQVQTAEYQPPKNLPGDYWLCLPTQIGPDQRPMGKGVNDLTDKSGLRVIQNKGLRITVGNGNLPEVGERPTLPSEQTLVIEHEQGTKITIANDGALQIEATGNKAITIKNDVGSIKVDSSGIEVKALKISLVGDGNVEINANGAVQIKGASVSIS